MKLKKKSESIGRMVMGRCSSRRWKINETDADANYKMILVLKSAYQLRKVIALVKRKKDS